MVNIFIHYRVVVWFQNKTSHWLNWHVSAGDPHNMYGRCITLRIYWGQLWTGITWCVFELYTNFIPVQCRMCPASVSNGSLWKSVCLSWQAMSCMPGWQCQLCCVRGWISAGWSAPRQRWVYCQYMVCHIKYTHDFAVFCFAVVTLQVDSCDRFFHFLQGVFTVTGSIVRLPRCQWSNPEIYG